MNAVIIEDEKIAQERLETLLSEINSDIKIVAKIASVEKSVEWLKSNSCDLIFLDIQLSDGISFEIFKSINVSIPIIFTTAFDKYAIQAFKVNSLAYLLKPISKIDLAESLDKYKSLYSGVSPDYLQILEAVRDKKTLFKQRFLVQVGTTFKNINTSDISFFYALGKGVYLTTDNNDTYLVDYTLEKLEQLLDSNDFFRINRKILISYKSITGLCAYSKTRIKVNVSPPMHKEIEALVSIEKTSAFKHWLDK